VRGRQKDKQALEQEENRKGNRGQMKNHDKKFAEELKQRLYSIDIPIADFRVFGSRAREDASEFPDMNIFIEVEDLSKESNMKILDAV